MTLPLLALVVDRHAPEPLLPLLAALTTVCRPAVLDPAGPAPAAALLSDVRLAAPATLPHAVWVERVEDVGSVPAATVILTRDEQVLTAAGERGLWVATEQPAGDVRPVTPFVRRRLRDSLGLCSPAVLEQTPHGAAWGGLRTLPDGVEVDTLLGLASAAVVLDPVLALRSLAWGTPTVVDPATAEAAGLRDGTEVLVGSDEPCRHELALGLAHDDSAATMLGRRGRLRVEQRHHVGQTAQVLASRLDLRPGAGLVGRGRQLLNDLGTPPDARVRARLAEALTTTSSGRRP